MRHHHHFYDHNDKAAIVSHDHDYTHATHNHSPWVAAELQGRPIFWDHDGTVCSNVIDAPFMYWTDG